MTNDGNECFWWCLTILMNKNIPNYLKLRYFKIYNKIKSNDSRLMFGLWLRLFKKKVNVESILSSVKQICDASCIEFFNLATLDNNHLPAFCSTIDINPTVIYQTHFKT